jgi:hypothetical protein
MHSGQPEAIDRNRAMYGQSMDAKGVCRRIPIRFQRMACDNGVVVARSNRNNWR